MKTLKFTLTLTGEVLPDGDDPAASDIAMTTKDLHRNLDYLVKHVMSNGLITGDTPATVETYTATVNVT